MPKGQEVVEAIGQQFEKIKELRGVDYEEFVKRHESLKNLVKQEQGDSPLVMEAILSLYADYPEVKNFLATTSPQLFAEEGAEQAPVTPIPSSGPQNNVKPPEGQAPETVTPPASDKPPPLEPAQIPAESKLQIFKESVTALLAVLVVSFTLGIAVYVIGKISDANFNQAKDILILLLGPFGTALGYYFGRLPADALATQAQQSAAQAFQDAGKSQAKVDQITDQAVKVADAAEAVVGETARTRGISGAGLMPDKTQRLQAETRELLRLARGR